MVINIICLIAVTFSLAVGQLLFKSVALELRSHSFDLLVTSPKLYVAFGVYGGTTLLWIWLLSRIPLSQAYPWVATSVVIVPLLARQFFGENVTPMFWVGLIFVLVGLIITQLAARSG